MSPGPSTALSRPCDASPLVRMDALATPLRRRRGEVICDAERNACYLYRVEEGAARRCALSADGRRRIVDLLFPGDFFGFAGESRSGSTIEALTDVTIVLRYPRREIEALADADPDAARVVRAIAFAAIARLETQIGLLGRVNAVEKVGAFLLALEERQRGAERSDEAIGGPPRGSGWLRFARNDGPCHDGPARLTLPVSRCDIGDFLALAPETVSRSLAALERRGAISLPAPRHVEIMDRAALGARRPARGERA
jgi:CRP/FNR family nitrogen fixation transcriptional regulator